jgi:hypothetical protein
MSTASASREVKYIKRSGTYMVTIAGDLFQEWVDNAGAIKVTPDFSVDKPILEFVCISSRVALGEVDIKDAQIRWFMNDTEIEFSNQTSTGVYAGLFKKTTNNGRQALQILANIATAAGYASATIKAIATVISDTVSDQLQATYTIPIGQRSGNTHKVTIAPGDAYNFVITANNSSCILKAMTYYNGVAADSSQLTNLSYKWYKLNGTTWAQQSSTSQTLTVSKDDIDTYAEYKVEVYESGATEAVGSDVQGVMDATDPYIVNPYPTPTSETIEEGSGDSVTYAPYIMTRGGTKLSTQPKFDFYACDSIGLQCGKAENVSSFEVTEGMCSAGSGDVTVIITSKEF